ncbi:Y-family DNA polymerase [Acidiphilium sp. C61]|uniref:Y-family DNA polymerase n=1 Tax=Acidiphilium sp. C61 TaxID=1671485 RepID=UPI00157A25B2|nr:Y-family DNA polymerase [Acidiphilium sp. C61]
MAVFGLIDGNSFYASCESAFAPSLRGRALVVLSNNDGCVIARSAEAKERGVAMGEPWHLVRERRDAADLDWRSSNYSLYGDMSRRMYDILVSRVPRVEPYSIDEMFLDLRDVAADLPAFCRALREEVRRVAKIPTCIGIGPSKTIAKLANKLAKDRLELGGVCDLRDPLEREAVYPDLPVSMVWGIGGRTAETLHRMGVRSIADLVAMDSRKVRDTMTVVGARVQAELRGVSCLPISMMAPPRKGITVSRAFSRPVSEWGELRETLAAYATRAAEKLRQAGLQATGMTVFLHTPPFGKGEWYSNRNSARIEATSDTLALIGEALRLLRPIWRPGLSYAKTGVMLLDLVDEASQPANLFPTREPARSKRIMGALDAINARFGRDTIRPLAAGIERPWKARAMRLSPRYTTRIDEILVAASYRPISPAGRTRP